MMNEMKNAIESFNSRFDQMEERICELKNRAGEFIQTENQKERGMKKTEDIFRDLRYHQVSQYFIVGVSEGEERSRQKVHSKK